MAAATPVIAEPTDPEGDAEREDARTTLELGPRERRLRRVALVVDDSADARDLCRETLEDEGFSVQTARDGQEALDLLFTIATPTIIILDLLMPKMDGHELLEVIRAYRRFAQVPVLIITATDGANDASPWTDVLHKPIVGDTLAERVRALLGESLH
jgi:CheY-like chemotaxis protein